MSTACHEAEGLSTTKVTVEHCSVFERSLVERVNIVSTSNLRSSSFMVNPDSNRGWFRLDNWLRFRYDYFNDWFWFRYVYWCDWLRFGYMYWSSWLRFGYVYWSWCRFIRYRCWLWSWCRLISFYRCWLWSWCRFRMSDYVWIITFTVYFSTLLIHGNWCGCRCWLWLRRMDNWLVHWLRRLNDWFVRWLRRLNDWYVRWLRRLNDRLICRFRRMDDWFIRWLRLLNDGLGWPIVIYNIWVITFAEYLSTRLIHGNWCSHRCW